MKTHVHLYSFGRGSWNATRVAVRELPREDHVLLFTDVLYEDADTYRFGLQGALQIFGRDFSWVPQAEDFPDYRVSPETPIESYVGNREWRAFLAQLRDRAAETIPELAWTVEGRDIWEIFRDERFLGNTQKDTCSKIGKREPRKRWLKANCDPARTIVYVGISDEEVHRWDNGKGKGFRPRMAAEGWEARAPLIGRVEGQVSANIYIHAAGLTPSRSYGVGYSHDNCGGMCCKAGAPAVALRLRAQPERAAYDALMEAKVIEFLGKPVAMFKRYVGRDENGKDLPRVPETRAQMHSRLAGADEYVLAYQQLLEPDAARACGCAIDDEDDEPAAPSDYQDALRLWAAAA